MCIAPTGCYALRLCCNTFRRALVPSFRGSTGPARRYRIKPKKNWEVVQGTSEIGNKNLGNPCPVQASFSYARRGRCSIGQAECPPGGKRLSDIPFVTGTRPRSPKMRTGNIPRSVKPTRDGRRMTYLLEELQRAHYDSGHPDVRPDPDFYWLSL